MQRIVKRRREMQMLAMVLERIGQPLVARESATPAPGPGEVLLRVEACGVCRTDLHVMDGELPEVRPPVTPGHEVVGIVEALGSADTGLTVGQRAGVCWLGGTCGKCRYCLMAWKTSAMRLNSRGTPARAGSPLISLPVPRSACPLPRATIPSPPRRCCAQASSAGVR